MEQDTDGVTKLLLENGDDIIIETQTFTDLGVAGEAGQITKVTILDDGNGYTSLPSIGVTRSVANPSATNADLIAISKSGVGSVKDVTITNYGLEYTGDPKVTFNKKLIIANPTGNYTIGDTLTSFTGSIVNWNQNTEL